MLMRSFTRREKALLLLLVLVLVVGLYFLLIHRPVEASLAELETEKEELEMETTVAETKLMLYSKMKGELDQIFALPADQITVMPAYNNLEKLMVQFDNIFTGMEPKLSFHDIRISEDGVVTRPIDFEFDAPSYEQARAILTGLTHTGNRALLDGLSIQPKGVSVTGGHFLDTVRAGGSIEAGAVSVKGSISFYELGEPPAKETPAPAAAEDS